MTDNTNHQIEKIFFMAGDAEVARQLSTLCDHCERQPSVDGHRLCDQCYRSLHPRCVMCSCPIARGQSNICSECQSDSDDSDDVPPEGASYEELLEWEQKRTQASDPLLASLVDVFPRAKGTVNDEDKQCMICLENYKIGDDIMTITCMHRYHRTCVAPWIASSPTCPVCKADVRDGLGDTYNSIEQL